MASGKGNYLCNKLLDGVLGGTNFVQPGTVYLALYTVAPTASGGGTEATGGGYARLAITNNVANFPAASGQSKSNGLLLAFPAVTADLGTIVAAALWDAVTSGNLLYFGSLTANRSVPNGAIADFPIGTITFTEA